MVAIGGDLLFLAVTVGMFSWLKKLGRKPPSSSATPDAKDGVPSSGAVVVVPNNAAFVFIKPHANTAATQALVREKLIESGITIVSELSMDGPTIDEKKLIDQHYYAIASKATILPAKDIPVPVDMFQGTFGESWETALQEDRAVNAMDACERFACTAQQLDDGWRAAEQAGKVVKFGGGFYCGLVTMEGQPNPLYVFNAFFMTMRSKFVEPGTSIYCFEVEWPASKLDWKDFRGTVLGPTDPAEAPEGSLRKTILDRYETLGLSSVPNKGDNGVHASASPLEGLAERMNWLGREIDQDNFGKACVAAGIPAATIKEWSVDPRIPLPDGTTGSVFDALEDLNAADCLEKMKQMYESSKK